MPVITVEGYLGSGYQNIGRKVARRLNIDFIDRFLLSQVSKLTNTRLRDVLELEKLDTSENDVKFNTEYDKRTDDFLKKHGSDDSTDDDSDDN